ncbi:MAG: ADP-ribosyltransferase [Methanobacteriaceae archaeon]
MISIVNFSNSNNILDNEYKEYKSNGFLFNDKKQLDKLDELYFLEANAYERTAILIYTLDNESKINWHFRKGKTVWENREIGEFCVDSIFFRLISKYMDSSTNKNYLKENTILYRRLEDISFIKNFHIGGVFEELGYLSTSFDIKIAKKYAKKGWILKINALKGVKGTYSKQYSANTREMEFTFPKNHKLLIIGIDERNRIITTKLY